MSNADLSDENWEDEGKKKERDRTKQYMCLSRRNLRVMEYSSKHLVS
jgi:hypothetical protein